MRDNLTRRILDEALFIIETGKTVRETAKEFDVSKSTVHKDVSERLYEIDLSLYDDVKKVLEKNLSERHLRGGEATKQKFKKLKMGIKTKQIVDK